MNNMDKRASSKRLRRAPWIVFGILMVLFPVHSVLAQSPQELFQKGVFLISRARFDESIKHLNQAKEATRDPALLGRIHLYLGINHSILGDSARSDESFREALRHNPELKLDPKRIKASIVERFKTIRASSRGELKVGADAPGAEVLVDGKKVGATPYVAQLPVGVHQVKVVHPRSGASYEERVTIVHGTPCLVTARLAPRPGPANEPGRKRVWTWVAAGTAAVTLGVAIGLGVSAKSDNDTFFDLPPTAKNGADLESSGRAKALGSNVMYGVAGALAATSVVLFFFEGKEGERKTAGMGLQVVPGPSPGLLFSTSF